MPEPAVYAGAAVAAVLGLVAGRLVTTRIDRRPLRQAWPVAVRRPRDAVVPVLLALGLAAVVVRFGYAPDLPAFVYLTVVAVAMATIDAAERILPDRLTLPSYVVGPVLLAAAAVFLPDGFARSVGAIVGLLVLLGFYFVMNRIDDRGMGQGDVKLAGVLGLYLGWLGFGTALAGALLGLFAGGLYALFLLVFRHAKRTDTLPFGPFMIAGAYAAILFPAAAGAVTFVFGGSWFG